MMTSDPLKHTIEAALQELRAGQESALHGLHDSLIAAFAQERHAVVSEARAVAEAGAAEKLAEALDKARTDADEALAIAEAIGAERLSEALAEAKASADRMRAETEAAAAEKLDQAVALARADADRAIAASTSSEREAALDGVERLLEAMRDVDHARSLSEILDTLVDRVSRETSRVAVLLVQGDHLRGWRFAGFDDLVPDARSVHLPLRDPTGGIVLKAIQTRAPSPTVVDSTDPSDAPPSFATLRRGRAGLAVPVDVGGRIVAVVYADDGAETPKAVPNAWPEVVEVLARHAARCLEALTAAKTGAVQPPSRREAPPPPATAASGQDEAARRYAKLLVSEIRLYNETTVTAGRRERNLLERLGAEIERARGLYNARIPPDARADHFNQELIRTLADGDPALLGHPA